MLLRFTMSAALHFNKEIPPEAAAAVKATVEEANATLFRRGVPPEADADEIGQITGWQVEDSSLLLTLESGTYTRAHDALFRIRKPLAAALGRHRLGLRGIEVRDYRIDIAGEIPEKAVPNLPMIRCATRDERGVSLELAVDAADLEKKIPDRLVRLIEEKIEALEYGGKTEHWELVFESAKRSGGFAENPTEEMLARGWIKHAPARGQWIFAPPAVQLFRAFERIVVEEIIGPLGFAEMIFPKFVPWEVWKRSGHAKGVYPEIYYVSAPKTRDPAYWEDVGDYFKVTGEVPVEMIRDRLEGPIGGMCYAQCPPFWPFVQGETLATGSLPIRIFDRSGTSHRYESGGIHGIERVDEFHRIEILWLGTAEQAVGTAGELNETYKRVFEEVLELEWRSARVTPWFMAQEGLAGVAETEDVGTTDYEAFLPYNETWLEFQNVSVAGNKYPKGFNVKVQSGEECWSGCSGIGLERWTAAFLAQKGFEVDAWPKRVRDLFGEPREIFHFL
ncbi:MAG: serine--tRNA ligase [Methanomicrobiaceae archaeon]|nr:serine--tRNA ligase [Methanomicrobiaceae archaeon]